MNARVWRRAALAAFFLLAPFARGEPAALTLYFDFHYNGIKAAEVRDTFSAQNGEYEISSHAKATGLAKLFYGDVIRNSAGKTDAKTGLLTERYETKRGRRPLQKSYFDRAANKLHLQKGAEKRTEDAPEEIVLDYLTALYRPYFSQKTTPGKTAVTDGWRLRIYEYKTGKAETVQTPLGEIAAVSLVRESPRGKRIFWFAPDFSEKLKYIPVKVRIEEKGHIFETTLSGIGAPGVK